ncbi:RloB family protein [Kibdelosporangium lantanae]|uniref:RloB family protein n=1 Tax=Kibdelosporangium lantanae TaxID=1497396 RepID=A0ABW3M3T6_9PSEU
MSRRQPLSAARSLTRRNPCREPRARFLLICEGEVTEPEYFAYVKEALRDHLLVIEISKTHGNPLQLVREAVARSRSAASKARKDRDDHLRYDQIWCVTDVDSHPQLSEAKMLAEKNGVHLAISNPCFELWPLLHIVDRRCQMTSREMQAELRQHMPGYEKSLDCAKLRGHYATARERAMSILKQHERDDNLVDSNPSTNVWQLVDELLCSKQRADGRVTTSPL